MIWLSSPFKNKIVQVSAAFASILAITHLAGVVFEAVAVLGAFAVDLLTGQVVARMDRRNPKEVRKVPVMNQLVQPFPPRLAYQPPIRIAFSLPS